MDGGFLLLPYHKSKQPLESLTSESECPKEKTYWSATAAYDPVCKVLADRKPFHCGRLGPRWLVDQRWAVPPGPIVLCQFPFLRDPSFTIDLAAVIDLQSKEADGLTVAASGDSSGEHLSFITWAGWVTSIQSSLSIKAQFTWQIGGLMKKTS